MEKPLDSYERQNSAESRHTDRRWLRLTGFATSLPFLPYWSSCSLVPLVSPSILLLSFHHWCVILWLPPSQTLVLLQQLCYSLHMTCRHDPKHTPKSQTGAPHKHKAAAKGSHMTEGGEVCDCIKKDWCEKRALWLPEQCCRRNNKERGMERRENIKIEEKLCN